MPAAPTVVHFQITPRTFAWVLATAAGVWLLIKLCSIVLILVVALVFAGILNPVVELLERRGFKRQTALFALFLTLNTLAGCVIFFTVPPLVEQIGQIARDAPAQRLELIELLEKRGLTAPFGRAVKNASLKITFAGVETAALGYSSQALEGLGYFVTTLFLAFYLLADGKRTQGVLYALVPRDYHMRLLASSTTSRRSWAATCEGS